MGDEMPKKLDVLGETPEVLQRVRKERDSEEVCQEESRFVHLLGELVKLLPPNTMLLDAKDPTDMELGYYNLAYPHGLVSRR